MKPSPLVLEHVRISRPRLPAAEPGSAVLSDGQIRWIGEGDAPEGLAPTGAERIDFQGAVLFPGFTDPHCHPLALGSALTAADCRPAVVRSIAGMRERMRLWASEHPSKTWVRAFGYDELLLRERRHPNRADLDAAVTDRPAVLIHGGGHALVLNTAGLRALGVDRSTDEPPGGFIDRESESGEPTGLLLDMTQRVTRQIREASRETSTEGALREYAVAASDAFVRAGVTAVTDAGASNDLTTFEMGARLRASRAFLPSVTVMRSAASKLPPLPPGAVRDLARWVTPGHIKVMLGSSGLVTSERQLHELVVDALTRGEGVAAHAVEQEAILACCRAFEAAQSRLQSPSRGLEAASRAGATHGRTHRPARLVATDMLRIEHAAETTPTACAAIERCGATVVTQPGFVYQRGDRYVAAARAGGCDPEDLYALRKLEDRGVHVRASSDAPYGPVAPLECIYGAVARRSESGLLVGPGQAITAEEALRLYFDEGRDAQGAAIWAGLTPGAVANLAVLSADPRELDPEKVLRVKIVATFIEGEPVWQA